MFSHLEKPLADKPGIKQIFNDFGLVYAANGFVGWLFSITAPVAIILAVANRGGLGEEAIASWVFGVFFVTD